MRGIYVHIPFCRRRCLYCDFFSVGSMKADWSGYVSALTAEAKAKITPVSGRQTIYFGGGTPSLMPSEEFKRLSQCLLDLTGPVGEFTVEVNPDDVTPDIAQVWKESGVNRISMGVQSMADDELRAIGRRHDSEGARKAYEIISPVFDNISLDIIFGLPGQTLDSLEYSLDEILKLRPSHISAYSLMYEERSALTRLRDSGKLKETPEDESFKMFEMITGSLKQAGYRQYEISNFALPGFESRHNSLYWAGHPYIGLGAGAHEYDGHKTRRHNLEDIKNYMAFWNEGDSETIGKLSNQDIVETETLGDDELREEFIMTRLRTARGIDLEEFERRFGPEERCKLMKRAKRYAETGDVRLSTDNLALTEKGFFISDDIMSSLF